MTRIKAKFKGKKQVTKFQEKTKFRYKFNLTIRELFVFIRG